MNLDDGRTRNLPFHHLPRDGAGFRCPHRQPLIGQSLAIHQKGLIAFLLDVRTFFSTDLSLGRERRQQRKKGKRLDKVATIHAKKPTPVTQILASEMSASLKKETVSSAFPRTLLIEPTVGTARFPVRSQ